MSVYARKTPPNNFRLLTQFTVKKLIYGLVGMLIVIQIGLVENNEKTCLRSQCTTPYRKDTAS